MVVNNWVGYIKQILNFTWHGYEYICPIFIPARKSNRLGQIDKKILGKYPACEWDKDKKYKAKKSGMANYVYLRWELCGVILHTSGRVTELEDSDTFYHLSERPYKFSVGSWISIKIGKARTGKKYTAYLTKESYRSIKAVLRENIKHQRWDEFQKYYSRLENLPAFSGILSQIDELYRLFRNELKQYETKVAINKLKLKKVY